MSAPPIDSLDLTTLDVGHPRFWVDDPCLGAGLARLELAIWIEETLRRYPDIRLDGTPRRVRSMIMNQQFEIPVRLRA